MNTDNKTISYYEKLAAMTPMLKRHEEVELLKKCINKKCDKSREKIIISYLKIVVSLSKNYSRNNNLNRVDLIHTGIVGIQNAIDKFDLSKYKVINENGSSLFGFFCYRAILKSLWDFYRENIRQFSVSDTSNTRLNNINKLYKTGQLNDKSEDEIIDLIKNNLKLKTSEVKMLLNMFKPAIELDKPIDIGRNEHDISPGDCLTKNNIDDDKDSLLNNSFDHTPISYLQEKERYSNLLNVLNEIPERDRAIIYYRYGIGCEKHTLSKLAKNII